MRPHEQRVVEEKAELDKKLTALDAFIHVDGRFAALPPEECERLRRQFLLMSQYSAVLQERIQAFPPERD